MDYNSPLDAALDYARRGWPVFPCRPGDKRPATRNGFKDAVTDAKRIRDWWRRRADYNVGITTGEVSGLVVLDVDPRSGGDETLAKLEAEHGRLPATVTAQTGGGGRHLLFEHPGGKVKCRAHALGRGLDVKADGGYIVAPPSLHASGRRYAWAEGLDPDSIGIAALPGWLSDRLANAQALIQTDTEDADIQQLSASPTDEPTEADDGEDCCKSCLSESLGICSSGPLGICSSGSLCHRVEDAIQSTLPTDTGQRNRAVFEFARALKAIPELAEADPKDLKGYVRQWHDAASKVTSGEHSFTDTWAEFLYGWRRIKHPRGNGPMADLLARADKAETPSIAADYDATAKRLVRLCRQLQRNTGDKPFFIGYRTAGELLGVDHNKACKLLGMLCAEGVLELASKGHTGKASEYRYIGGD